MKKLISFTGVVGTPSYMCPELLADIPYGSKSDLWSLGMEMAAKPAFKAFDIQALINKINKSIVAPLSTMYSGSFRRLVKSMLRKNPEPRPSAAELLNHPHLQPYFLKIHLKLNSPRTNHFPFQWPESKCVKRTRFVEPGSVSTISDRDKRLSFSNDRTLHPSISGTGHDSQCSTQRADESPAYLDAKHHEISVNCEPKIESSPGFYHPPRKQTPPSKISRTGSKPDSLPVSHTIAGKSSPPRTRRASLPLPVRTMVSATPYRANIGLLQRVDSPDVSVNAPRIGKIADFPLASCEDPLFPVRRTSSACPQCFSSSPGSAECSITKDKGTVQVVDKASVRTSATDACPGAPGYGSECSEYNVITGVSSRSSGESRQRRFDTSSYQQRAEALDGLLEFSARLLQQQKVSPRETTMVDQELQRNCGLRNFLINLMIVDI
ncbi:hypothetical protein L6164_034521 [Bauhinia variegata]|uniref:Uncharacterized protein n=1 Tax=Bauhinia variegata TaxID=167791 RepID=A0ACB9KV70_BAUVA|nr:hypothetical protein L6164_034521 [Bauhinia variegata]